MLDDGVLCPCTSTMAATSTKVILFYKYSPLSNNEIFMNDYRDATQKFCQSLSLFGRILIGKSENEGINGTLSGTECDLNAYIIAMLGRDHFFSWSEERSHLSQERLEAIQLFWEASESFAKLAQVPILVFDSREDFKWSDANCDNASNIFPDLYVKVVKEIIGTGGVLATIPLSEVNKGYLTPEEFHQEVSLLKNNNSSDTILIDCRNHNEYQIGNFDGALDPNTKTFAQFPKWVDDHKSELDNKKVLMYCTGGIRCEKASAYIRNQTNATNVFHLRGGIHMYLSKFGSSGFFRGKNFVFDRRGSDAPPGLCDVTSSTTSVEASVSVVGTCFYCNDYWDKYTGDAVCTVCRESMLVCNSCRSNEKEYHCSDHKHLKDCYFKDLSKFSDEQLTTQILDLRQHLENIAIGKKFKQKRKTITKQIDLIQSTLTSRSDGNGSCNTVKCCRSCGIESCAGDAGECWGFYGRKGEKA